MRERERARKRIGIRDGRSDHSRVMPKQTQEVMMVPPKTFVWMLPLTEATCIFDAAEKTFSCPLLPNSTTNYAVVYAFL